MWWRLTIEVIFAVFVLLGGTSLWAILKAPAHLRRILLNPVELVRVAEFFGRESILADAVGVAPIGTFAANIAILSRAHIGALRKTLPLCVLAAIGGIGCSYYFLGPWYSVGNAALALMLALPGLPPSAANYNIEHVRSILVILCKWNSVDPEACAHFCLESVPHGAFEPIYHVVENLTGIRSQSAGP
jgi:hypothetical protein